jgi:hypothetical protein
MKIIIKNTAIFLFIGLIFYFISSCNKDDIVVNNTPQDLGILRTDELGHILGGDYNDWCIHTTVDTFTTILSFKVSTSSNNILKLEWKTSKQYHCYGFDVERSLSTDTLYSKIGFVSGGGTSNDTIAYVYFDTLNSNVSNYKYRLKIIDIFGNFKYWYSTLSIHPIIDNYFFGPVYPNPVKVNFNIRFAIPLKDTVSMYFLNTFDSVFLIKNEVIQPGTYELDVSNSFNYHNIQKRLYFKCHSLPQSDSCRNYGDIQFE